MTLFSESIEKILQEVDPDIKEIMIKEENGYKFFELINSPLLVIFEWQKMRDMRKYSGLDKMK